MLVTATPMSALPRAIGLRVLQRMANATLVFGWDQLRGVLSDEPVDAMLGSVNVQSRRKLFLCAAADLAEIPGGVQPGLVCALDSVAWQVAEVTQHPQTGQATLQLERA